MNSGRMVERRDQVLIGFFSLPPTAASTFLIRCASTNGPFLIERDIARLLFPLAPRDNHIVCALVTTGPVALGGSAPRADRLTALASAAFAATVRVIHRVHDHATNGRTNPAPARGTGLADLAQAVVAVADFADGGAAVDMHATDLAGAQADLCVNAFTSEQHRRCTGRAGHLGTLARQQLHAVNRGTHRNGADGQRVADAD